MYIITNYNLRFVLELRVWTVWQSVSLPYSLQHSSFTILLQSLMRWLTVVGGGFQTSWVTSISKYIFFPLCIQQQSFLQLAFISKPQMQVWKWRQAANCPVRLFLSGAIFPYLNHYFYNRQNRLIERQEYIWRVPTTELLILPWRTPLRGNQNILK